METKILGSKGSGRNDVLYAILLIAGVLATIFSVIGIAMITGLIPQAQSTVAQHREVLPALSVLVLVEPSRSNPIRIASGAFGDCDVGGKV